ncbi:unnamed protein product [Cylindrotheca closterium]|uniref:Nucleotide-diphospho-sugar transferase domain-containing protein n=1 Tax=Cylindrotheca closterium TaxID=2856 RepID=A0AAD2G6X2_9STRA|nr:unnamed protein product [Cylindrotheca closterium]
MPTRLPVHRKRPAKASKGTRTLNHVLLAISLSLIVGLLVLNSSFIHHHPSEQPFGHQDLMIPRPLGTLQDRILPDWYLTTECSIYSIDCVSRETKRNNYQSYPFPLVNPNLKNGTLPKDNVIWKPARTFPTFQKKKEKSATEINKVEVTPHKDAQTCVQKATTRSLKEQLDDLLPAYNDFKQKDDHMNERIVYTISDYSYAKDMIDDAFYMARVIMKLDYFFLVAMDKATIQLACDRGYPVMGWPQLPANMMPEYNSTDADSYKSTKKVADVALSKWLIALEILERQFPLFFFEMDVWFLKSPKSLWKDQDVDVIFSGHADNPNYVNIGIYSVLPTPKAREYFEICIDLFKQRPKVHDQLIMMQILYWEMAAKKGEEIKWRKNMGNIKDVWGLPPPEFPKFPNGYVTHGRFPIWAIVSGERPILSEQIVAIHVLCGKPLTAPHGKKQMAKEMGAWIGSNGYYDSADAKYLWVDGHIFNAISMTMTHSGRHDWYHYHDMQMLRWTIACTIALANHTGRIWVMPKVVNNRGLNFLWSILDMETVEPFVEVRETNFPSNPQTWKTTQRYNPTSRIAISGDEKVTIQLYQQYNAWSTKSWPEAWDFPYQSASDSMEKWFALADLSNDARLLLAGLPASRGLLLPIIRLYDKLKKERTKLSFVDLKTMSETDVQDFFRKEGIQFFDVQGNTTFDPSVPVDNILRVYDSLKWCKHTFDDAGLLELLPSRVTASSDCYGQGKPSK